MCCKILLESSIHLKYDRFVGGMLGVMVAVKSIGFVVGARDCGCDGMNRCVSVESGGSQRRQQQEQGCQFAHAPNVPLPPPCHSHQGEITSKLPFSAVLLAGKFGHCSREEVLES